METPPQNPDSTITPRARSVAAEVLGAPVESLTVTAVSGGYSRNRRSIVSAGQSTVFVKEVDIDLLPSEGEEELAWLQKEYQCTTRLREVVPEMVPEYSAIDPTGHVLVTSAYPAEAGWHWTPPTAPDEAQKYMRAVIDTVTRLEGVSFDQPDIEALKLQPFFRDELAYDDGFELITHNEAVRTQIIEKLQAVAQTSPHKLQFGALIALFETPAALSAIQQDARALKDQPNDAFGHCDVRSDNLCYNAGTGEVKLVDWNWASYTPKGFGATEFLNDMARRGYDVSPFLDSVNHALIASLVGFYAKRCIKDPLAPGNTLREMQAETAALAYDVYLQKGRR